MPPDKLKVVLNLQKNDSPGNYEDISTLKLNPWLTDFNKKRSEYFDKILQKQTENLNYYKEQLIKKPSDINLQQKVESLSNYVNRIDPMGIKIPTASKELQAKIDKANKLTGTEKTQYYADNTDITEYFKQQDDYQRIKRGFMALPQFDRYPTPTPEVQNLIKQYNDLPKNNGPLKKDGTPSSPQRSDWIKSHPQEWASMSEQFNKQTIYNLQREAAQAVYEGIDISQKTLEKLGLAGQKQYPVSQPLYLSDFVRTSTIPNVAQIKNIQPKKVKKYQVKLASTTRRTKRIRLQ